MFSFARLGRVNKEIWYACYSEGHNNISKFFRTSEHKDTQESKSKTTRKSHTEPQVLIRHDMI